MHSTDVRIAEHVDFASHYSLPIGVGSQELMQPRRMQ